MNLMCTFLAIATCFSTFFPNYTNSFTNSSIVLSSEALSEVYDLNKEYDTIKLINHSSANNELPYIIAEKATTENKVGNTNYKTFDLEIIGLEPLRDINSNLSASGQQYGIAASNTLNYTLSWSKSDLSDMKIKFNSMSAKYTNLPTNETSVIKMEYSAKLEPPVIGNCSILSTGQVNNPISGISYSKNINSEYKSYGADNVIVMISLYYKNGTSSHYENSLSSLR